MKNILVVIDMQNDFIDMALGSPAAAAIVPAVVQLIQDPAFDAVYATQDTHAANYLSTLEGQKLPVVHCVRGTPGWQLNPKVAKALQQRQAVIIEKPTFGSLELARQIAAQQPEQITVCGLCTDICVVSNAMLLRAWLPDARIVLAASASAATTPQKQQETIDVLASCQIDAE